MKATTRTFIIAVFTLIILGGGFVIQSVSAQTPEPQPFSSNNGERLRTVSVSGTGRTSAIPDQALFRVGVQTEAENAGQALQQNSQQMRAVLQELRQAGVANQDIQTQSIQLFPRYDQRPEPLAQPELIGYTAVNIVEVRVRNINNLGTLLDTAVEAGANTIEGIRFEVSNREQLLQQGREQAMQNARQKAEQLANLANAELGEVLTIQETTFQPSFIERGMPAADVAQVPVEPGAQAIDIEIQVTWLLQ